jgi:hypothetical protein
MQVAGVKSSNRDGADIMKKTRAKGAGLFHDVAN